MDSLQRDIDKLQDFLCIVRFKKEIFRRSKLKSTYMYMYSKCIHVLVFVTFVSINFEKFIKLFISSHPVNCINCSKNFPNTICHFKGIHMYPLESLFIEKYHKVCDHLMFGGTTLWLHILGVLILRFSCNTPSCL